jgi:pimeloyl-ACP methyl ester carboxylesterase
MWIVRRSVCLPGMIIALLLIACSESRQAGQSGTAPAPAVQASIAAATASPELPAARQSATPPPVSFAPRFEQGPCPFRPAQDATVRAVTCGFVEAPEDHADPSGRTIRLAVALFRSAGANRGTPPLVWLDGGPGGASLDSTGTAIAGSLARALVADRDLILIDQRGTGFTLPSLACPEVVQAKYELWARRVSEAEETEIALRARAACRTRLAGEGINLAAYTSAQNAADVNLVRAALGYQQVSLYGVSYGTRLALTVLRDFPGIVHSIVLDSAVPVQANLYTEIYASAQRSFDTLFAACAADPACNGAYPDLSGALAETVARLDASPPTVRLQRARGGASQEMVLTGDRFTSALFQALYSTRLLPTLPAVLSEARSGNFDPFVAAVRDLLMSDTVAWGMYYSVQCGEELRFTTRAEVTAARSGVRAEIASGLGGQSLFGVCALWGAKDAPLVENQPVASSVPALVLAGQFDPVTPPSWGRMVAANLSNSAFYEFPGSGHGALFSGSCPLSMTAAFLRDPTARPDASCIETMTGPRWLLPRR